MEKTELKNSQNKGSKFNLKDSNKSRKKSPIRLSKIKYEEKIVQIKRVTKVVKGGKKMTFRAVVIIGDSKGNLMFLEAQESLIKSNSNDLQRFEINILNSQSKKSTKNDTKDDEIPIEDEEDI